MKRKTAKILSLLLCICLIFTMFPATTFADAGTADLSIGTPAELMAFATAVNGGNDYAGKTVALTADIDLTTPVWTTITGTFNGTFDGNLKTVINPDATLFKTIGTAGIVRNLGVIGQVGYSVGSASIAATNNGIVENSYNTMKITTGSNTFSGGLVQTNAGTIRYCYNSGAVSASSWPGGIAGKSSGTVGSILNCYNTGTVTGGNWTGGIIADTQNTTQTIKYCYSSGIVETTNSGRAGSIVGRNGTASTVTDCYFTITTSGIAGNYPPTGAIGTASGAGTVGARVALKTSAEMQDATLVALLNTTQSPEPWVLDTAAANGGYPILSWQAAPAAPVTDTAAPTWSGTDSLTITGVTTDGFTVSYPAASDDTAVSRYKIQVSSGGSSVRSEYTAGQTKTFTGLSDNTSFTCTVTAEDAAGNISASLTSNVKTLYHDVSAPTWITGAAILVSDTTTSALTVNYPAASDDVGVVKYNIILKQGSTVLYTGSTNDLSKTIAGLTEALTYNVTVGAEDAAGNKSILLSKDVSTSQGTPAWSAEAELTVSNLEATALTLTWKGVSNPLNVSGYVIYIDGAQEDTVPASQAYYDLGGLDAGRQYILGVRAVNEAGAASTMLQTLVVTDGGGGLLFTFAPFATDLGENGYYHNYVFKNTIDPDHFSISWNFDHGLDKSLLENLQKITLTDKSSGKTIPLDLGTPPYFADPTTAIFSAGDFNYFSSGSTDVKQRLLNFEPTAATLAKLTPGNTYVISFAADFVANNGTATLGKIFTFQFKVAEDDSEAPVWPGGAKITSAKTGTDFVDLTWDSAADNIGVSEYDIYRQETSGAGITEKLLDTIPGDVTSYRATALTPGDEYTFIIRAKDAKANISGDLSGNFMTLIHDDAAPTWPAASSMEVENVLADNLDLNWSKANDNIDVTGYQIIKNGSVIATVEGDINSYHVMGLMPGTAYSFEVEAQDAAGNVSESGTTLAISTPEGTVDTTAPVWNGTSNSSSTVYNLYSATTTLTWPWATDDAGVYDYLVYRSGTLIATVDRYSNSYTDTITVNETDYVYSIYAVDLSGNRSTAQSMTVHTGGTDYDLSPPTWPASTSITLSDFTSNTVKVSWTPCHDNIGICQYEVLNGQMWIENLDVGEKETSHKSFKNCWVYYDNGAFYGWGPGAYPNITSGGTYTFSLMCWDYALNSSKGNPKITFVQGIDPTAGSGIGFELTNAANTRGSLNSSTGALNNVTAAQDPENIRFAWKFDEALADGYLNNITLAKADGTASVALDSADFTYAGGVLALDLTKTGIKLDDGCAYIVKFGKNLASASAKKLGFDIGWQFMTATADKSAPVWGATDSLSVRFIKDPTIATLSWEAATDDVAVTQYKIYKNNTLIKTLSAGVLAYDVTGLTPGTNYDFKVVAGDYLENFNTGMEQAIDAPVADVTTPFWTGTPVLTFSAGVSDNQTVSWPAASDNYQVKYYDILKNGVKIAEVGAETLSYKITGLSGETAYDISVKAIDYSGNTALLNSSVTTSLDDVVPVWPTSAALTAKNIKDVSVTLNWTAATDNVGVTAYKIYEDGILLNTVSGSAIEYNVTGLYGSTEYKFTVEAYDLKNNKTAGVLELDQWTAPNTINGGAAYGFDLEDPASVNMNYDKASNTLNNTVDGSFTKNTVIFNFTFAKNLKQDSWLSNYTLKKADGTSVALTSTAFTYSILGDTSALRIAVDPKLIESGNYVLTMGQGLQASDGTSLGRTFTWTFSVSAGVYGITDIASGFNSYSSFILSTDRFYVMLKDDGTVWTWGNNDYGTLGDGTITRQDVPTQIDTLQNIVSVAAGRDSAFALDKDGNLYGWGSNEYAQLGRGTVPTGTSGRYGNNTPVKVVGLPSIKKISYGFGTVVAVDIYGNVWNWGNSVKSGIGTDAQRSGTPLKVDGLSNIVDVASSYYKNYALTADGDVYSFSQGNAPVHVTGISEIKSLGTRAVNQNNNYVMALKTDGTAYIWDYSSTPTVVVNAAKIRKIVADGPYVIGADNKVYNINYTSGGTASLGTEISGLGLTDKLASSYWGGLDLQQDGTLTNFIFYKHNAADNEISDVALNMDTAAAPDWSSSAALTVTNKAETALTLNWDAVDNHVSSYGIYQNGTKIGATSGTVTTFDVNSLTVGTSYNFTIQARYVNSGWSTDGPQTTCAMALWAPSMAGAGKIAVTDSFTLLAADDGTVYSWGQNQYGQLGLGDTAERLIPTLIPGLSNIVAVAAGEYHSVALDKNGNVWEWGRNNVYQLGNGTTADSSVPVKLAGIIGTAVSAAGNYTLTLGSDGYIYIWGDASNTNIGIKASGLDGKTPGKLKCNGYAANDWYYFTNVKGIAAAPDFITILDSNGKFSRIGYFVIPGTKTYSFIPDLAGDMPMGTAAIDAGDDFVVGLRQDGTVVVAGDNTYGQFGNGTQGNGTWVTQPYCSIVPGLNNIVNVAAGGDQAAAVDKDGNVWTWGLNASGQLGDGTVAVSLVPKKLAGLSGISFAGAGSASTIAYKNASEIYAWGSNSGGQLGNAVKVTSKIPVLVHTDGFASSVPAPAWPTYFGISATKSTKDSITIAFTPASTQLSLKKYEIYVGSTKAGETADGSINTYTLTGLSIGQNYLVGVVAIDINDNASVLSKTITVSTDKITPPVLSGDITDNIVGKDIDFTFADDPSWRNAIGSISVNSADLSHEQYSMTAGAITLDKSLFPAIGSYAVVIKAVGYADLAVTQRIAALGDSFVTFRSPSNTAESYEVDADAQMTIGFAEPIAPTSVSNGADIILRKIGILSSPTTGSVTVDCSYTLSNDGTSILITPKQILDYGARYMITVPAKLSNKQGKTLGTDASVTFYTKPAVIPATATVTVSGGTASITTLEPGKTYTAKIQPTNGSASAFAKARVYMVVRGGIGARLEHGGDILASQYVETSAAANGVFGQQTIIFTVPANITGNVYVDVMMREADSVRANPRMLAETKHFELQVTGEEE